MLIRQALLDDTAAISALFRNRIERWQRMDSQGRVEDLSYTDLSLYERWLHGGAWMSIETGALWLSHLLKGGGFPFVSYQGNELVAYAEVYQGNEPEPFGKHWHIGQLASVNAEARDETMQWLLEQAAKIKRLTASCLSYDEESANFYKRYGLRVINQVQRVNLRAISGSTGFYKASERLDIPREKIDTWHMPLGRTENARQHWEHLWVDLWQALPQIAERRTQRLVFNVAGLESLVCVQQALYNSRSAEVYCWTPKALTNQLLSAIREWGYSVGYRTLSMVADEKTIKMLGTEAESTPFQQVIFAREV